MTPTGDGDFSEEKLKETYNGDLANGLGNLVSRVARLCEKSGLEFKPAKVSPDKNVGQLFGDYRFDEALKKIWENVTQTDQFINEEEPWKLKGKDLEKVLIHLVDHVRSLAINLAPFLPDTAKKVEEKFKGPKILSSDPIFPRLK